MKYIALILLFFISNPDLGAQSIYHFKYKFPNANDSTLYEAFFVRYNSGNGFIRVSYQSTGFEESKLVEIKIQERNYIDPAGMMDTNKLFYKTSAPVFLKGIHDSMFRIPVFWFSKKPADSLFDPVAVSISGNTDTAGRGMILQGYLAERNDLSKDLVLRFFKPGEDFYTNLFTLRSRGFSEEEKKIKLHLLIVANTNDNSIGPSCNRDMNRMLQTFSDLADYTGVTMSAATTKTIYGSTYNLKNIQNAIKDLHPAANDIVIFYYTGHGFRKEPARNGRIIPYQKSRFPFLDFRANANEDYNSKSMNVEEIFNIISNKGARLNLVLSDCCNNIPGSTNNLGRAIPASRGPALDWSDDNIRDLFLNPNRLSVLATAADKGQLATGANSFGGFFSYFFKTSMETNFSVFRKNVTWDMVIAEAAELTATRVEQDYCAEPATEQNRCRQNPFFSKKNSAVTGN